MRRHILFAVGILLSNATISHGAATALQMAQAMDIPTNTIVSATYTHLANIDSANVAFDWGVNPARAGGSMAVISSGKALDLGSPGYVAPQNGSAFSNSALNPMAGQTTCGGTELTNVFDITQLTLVLTAPTNAYALFFKFNFFSVAYPEWICSTFNDRFMAVLESQSFTGNIAFDSMGNPVSVNTAFFAVTNGVGLQNTGMGGTGAATGWIATQAPVAAGETLTLKFIVFDAGDRVDDSLALIDDFEWITPVPPMNFSAPTIVANENQLFAGPVATFTDIRSNAKLGDYSASINWGDGHSTGVLIVTNIEGGFYIVGATTYVEGGDYPVQITVTNSATDFVTNITTTAIVPPALGIQPGETSVSLSWATNASAYNLNSSSNITGDWISVTNPAVIAGKKKVATDPATSPSRFYRLHRPSAADKRR